MNKKIVQKVILSEWEVIIELDQEFVYTKCIGLFESLGKFALGFIDVLKKRGISIDKI